MDKEQARQRREEAQKANMLQQARRIAEQRELAARQKNAAAARSDQPQAATGRASTRRVQPAPKTPPAAPAPAPPRARSKVHPVAVPAKPAPAAPTSALDAEEMRAEMRAFAHENDTQASAVETPPPAETSTPAKARKTRKVEAPVPPPRLDEIEIETIPADTEMPDLKLASNAPGETAGPLVVDLPDDFTPPALNPLTRVHTLKLKMEKSGDLACPKCGYVIPESQRGALYTECRRCGEIIKSDAA